MKKYFPKTFLYFLVAWLVLNIVQSAFTGIIYDEAYYWYYSQQMAWGYFDHPPMVALLIKLSSFFFDGELGVRLFSTFLSAGSVLLLWLMIDAKEKEKYVPHFFLLLFSMALFNAYGFLTLPDTPLLFFTALFLYLYKKFVAQPNWPLSIGLGLAMAALMYSKYHAVLVIVFVILSNLKLLKSAYAWVAVTIALAAFTPHFIWLYEHDFVTIKYHILERPNHAYDFAEFTLGYLLNLIANFGLLFPFVYWALFKLKPKDKFERALQFLSYGVILFFFVSSFQKRTQTQWVIVLCIPLAIIAFNYLIHHAKSRKWMKNLGLVSLVLLCYARLWLVFQPLLPFMFFETHEYPWTQQLHSIVGDTPVVFENSYRRAPMYSFYTGENSFSLNNLHYRRNQYSIDSSEAKLQGKKVAYITLYANKGDFTYTTNKDKTFYGWYIPNFESYRKLLCTIAPTEVDLSQANQLVKVYNPYKDSIPLHKLSFNVGYLNRYKKLKEKLPLPYTLEGEQKRVLKPKDTTYIRVNFPKPTRDDIEYLKFSISENGLLMGINSTSIKIKK